MNDPSRWSIENSTVFYRHGTLALLFEFDPVVAIDQLLNSNVSSHSIKPHRYGIFSGFTRTVSNEKIASLKTQKDWSRRGTREKRWILESRDMIAEFDSHHHDRYNQTLTKAMYRNESSPEPAPAVLNEKHLESSDFVFDMLWEEKFQ